MPRICACVSMNKLSCPWIKSHGKSNENLYGFFLNPSSWAEKAVRGIRALRTVRALRTQLGRSLLSFANEGEEGHLSKDRGDDCCSGRSHLNSSPLCIPTTSSAVWIIMHTLWSISWLTLACIHLEQKGLFNQWHQKCLQGTRLSFANFDDTSLRCCRNSLQIGPQNLWFLMQSSKLSKNTGDRMNEWL